MKVIHTCETCNNYVGVQSMLNYCKQIKSNYIILLPALRYISDKHAAVKL